MTEQELFKILTNLASGCPLDIKNEEEMKLFRKVAQKARDEYNIVIINKFPVFLGSKHN